MKKDDLLQLRVSQADMILYRQAAEAEGDSLSNWVRRMLRQAVIAGLGKARLTRPEKGQPDPNIRQDDPCDHIW
jgi:hypothetical protein